MQAIPMAAVCRPSLFTHLEGMPVTPLVTTWRVREGAVAAQKRLRLRAVEFARSHTMDRHEEAVMQLLTANGETFVAHHYDVAAGWQAPAFVALRPTKRQLYVVEVSASGFPLGLVNKLNERVAKWYAPLLMQLQGLGVTDAEWDIQTLVFVRSDQVTWLQERVKDLSGVHVLSLEQASADWSWADLVWSADYDFASGEVPQRGVVKPMLTH